MCVLSLLLFSLYTNNCTSGDPSVKLLQFAVDTTVIDLMQECDESAYRQEVEQLAFWWDRINLELNTLKIVEMTVDDRIPPTLPPLTIQGNSVSGGTIRFLGSTISWDLRWTSIINIIRKKAKQRMYLLCQLRTFNLAQELLIQFYSAIIQSVL